MSDGGVFKNCNLYQALEKQQLNIPQPTTLPGTQILFPFVIVADDAFPLKDYILKPYSQRGLTRERRIFNYRLSRARRVVENAFGILANRFRVFMTPISLQPEKVEKSVMACCVLHNFLRAKVESSVIYMPPGSVDIEDPDTHGVRPGDWHKGQQATGLLPISHQAGNRHSNSAQAIRNQLCQYFNSLHGSVPRRWNMV